MKTNDEQVTEYFNRRMRRSRLSERIVNDAAESRVLARWSALQIKAPKRRRFNDTTHYRETLTGKSTLA